MLIHNDFDIGSNVIKEEMTLPDEIDKIDFCYDGGRLVIGINGVNVYEPLAGTRDFCITITKEG
jgi:hypothetical protein